MLCIYIYIYIYTYIHTHTYMYIYIHTFQIKAAIQHFSQAIVANPKDPENYFKLRHAFFLDDRYAQAHSDPCTRPCVRTCVCSDPCTRPCVRACVCVQ